MQTGGGVSMGRHVTVNRLEISKMTRSALNNTYKCQASNTKLVPPAERTIRVDMLLKPLSTALSSKPKQLIAEQEYVLACNVEGSVPETDIKWMQNNRLYTKGKIKTINNSSMVSSVLSFRPHPDDDGTILKCEGSNPRLQNSALEDSVIMNVLYPPQVTLSLGSTLNPADIKEGDDVYFECHIKANPREHRITWSHDGQPVTQNVTSGVIISTRSLVLQHVGRFDSGSYACAAANDRGETQSEPVALKIHCKYHSEAKKI
uniref:Ig-like domain-containing protein n=1 Tax=Anopheles atroparvus TaxID=41427 RepID=A0A182J5S9_ANOAO